MRIAAMALATLALSACQGLQIDDNHLTSRDWAPSGPKRQAEPAAAWCYKTIGRPDCYHAPLPGQEYRLASSGPRPPAAAPMPEPAKKMAAAEPKAEKPAMEAAAADSGFIGRAKQFFGL